MRGPPPFLPSLIYRDQSEVVLSRGLLLLLPFRLCRILHETLNYLNHFARFTQKENVEAVERLLSTHKDLAKFERAQLGMRCTSLPPLPNHKGESENHSYDKDERNSNAQIRTYTHRSWLTRKLELGSLCCGDSDEAKTLIPSLQDKISDDDLQELLYEISKLQNR